MLPEEKSKKIGKAKQSSQQINILQNTLVKNEKFRVVTALSQGLRPRTTLLPNQTCRMSMSAGKEPLNLGVQSCIHEAAERNPQGLPSTRLIGYVES